MRRRFGLIAALTIVSGVALRAYVVGSHLGRPNGDESVVGLMAMAIQNGARPTFFWGQAYGGTGEIGLTALMFSLFGRSNFVLHLTPLLLTAASAVLVWRSGRRTIDEPAAGFAGALVLVFPAYFVWWFTKAGGYYTLALLLTATVLLLVLRLRERVSMLEVGALGFAVGVCFWTTPQTGFVVLPLLIWLAVRVRDQWRAAWPAPIGFVIGAAPWLWWNARNGWESLETPPGLGESTYLERLRIFFTHALPEMLGLKYPFTRAWRLGPGGVVLYLAVLALIVALIVFVIRRGGERRNKLEPLLVALVAFPFIFAIAPTSLYTREPRYTATLVPIAVLLVCAPLRKAWTQLVALGIALMLSVSTLGSLAESTNFYIRGPALGALVAELDRQDTRRVYADYWIAYPLDFATENRIAASPVDAVRDPALDAVVAVGNPSSYVLWRNSARDKAFARALDAAGVGYERTEVARFAVYRLDRIYRPGELPAGFWQTYPS
jgi:hypothetical protein